MLAKLVPDLRNRQGCGLQVHEFCDSLDPIAQFVIDRMVDAGLHREPRQNAKRGQTETDGSFFHTASSRSAYPIPRTVWISFRLPGRSILARNCRIKTSSVLLSMSRSYPHTASIIRARVITRPAFRISISRSTNSVRVRGTNEPPRLTSRAAGSRTRSSIRSLVLGSTFFRLESARSLASKILNAKGFVR